MTWFRSVVRLLAIATGALLVAGCGADATGENADGASLYISSCASCHARDLSGRATGPPLRAEVHAVDQFSDAEFATAISDGVSESRWGIGVMPSFGNLSDAQIERIIAHIRAEQDRLGLIDTEPTP